MRCVEFQIRNGRYFSHENTQSADIGNDLAIERVYSRFEVGGVIGDMCQCGTESLSGEGGLRPVEKPTGWMSNGTAFFGWLSKLCPKDHTRTQLLGKGRAQQAARYPADLCIEILRGVPGPSDPRMLKEQTVILII